VIDLQEGRRDQGLVRLQKVVKRLGDGPSVNQRLLTAAALFAMAEWHEGQAGHEQAHDLYGQIVYRFGLNEIPEIRRFVGAAQRQLALFLEGRK
jgi:hypothetical protein